MIARGSSPFVALTWKRDVTFRRGAIMLWSSAVYEHKSWLWLDGVVKRGERRKFRANNADDGHACLAARASVLSLQRFRKFVGLHESVKTEWDISHFVWFFLEFFRRAFSFWCIFFQWSNWCLRVELYGNVLVCNINKFDCNHKHMYIECNRTYLCYNKVAGFYWDGNHSVFYLIVLIIFSFRSIFYGELNPHLISLLRLQLDVRAFIDIHVRVILFVACSKPP